jgi:hypothetical protein
VVHSTLKIRPGDSRRNGVDLLDRFEESGRLLEDFLVLDEQRGSAEEQIESDILRMDISNISAEEQGKSLIAKDCGLAKLPDGEGEYGALWVGTRVHGSVKVSGFEDRHRFDRKTSLRENHHFAAM